MFRTVPVLMFIVTIIGCSSASDQHRPGSTSTGDAKSRVNDIVSYDTQSNRTKIVPASYRKPKYGLDTMSVFDTAVNAGFRFKIAYNTIEYSNHQKDHNLLLITHNQNLIYCDSSQNEYELNDSLNPSLISLGRNTFELFLEVDDRPNKNYLKMLKIQSDKVIDSQRTPAFSFKPCHLYGDTTLVYADTWGYPEAWTDSANRNLVTCDPIMYYKLTKNGLILDSIYTIKKNKEIFEIANVFTEKELKSIPISKDSKRKKEIKRIMNCR